MYVATLHLPGSPDPQTLVALLEIEATETCAWYLDEWRRGRKPECCCKCAGVRYDPKRRSIAPVFRSISEVFAQKTASCEEAAYIDVGARRAEAIRDGMQPDVARELWQVMLQPRNGKKRWHAVMQTPNGIVDVAQTLSQAKCPCGVQR